MEDNSTHSSDDLPVQTLLNIESTPGSVRLAATGDVQMRLYSLIEQLETGELLSPPHQREFIWDMGRRRAWIDRLAHGSSRAVGCIVTYQINDGRSSATFINDGWQRLSTTREYLASPEKYGSTAQESMSVVKNYTVTVQHRHYESQEEALADFQGLNLGTSLTPFEFHYGTLSTMPNFDVLWHPLLYKLHTTIQEQARLCGLPKGRDRHKYLRHDYALFHYILTDQTALTDFPSIAANDVKVGDRKDTIEAKLRAAFLDKGVSVASAQLQRLLGIIRDDTALIETEWHKVRPSPANLISNSVWRSLLHIGLWRRANDVPVACWQDFLTRFLTEGQGLATFTTADGSDRISVGMSSTSRLSRVCKLIGSTLVEDRQPRAKRPSLLRAGYDASHVQPYLTNGNGPTVPEPASLNRSRGAQPMVVALALGDDQ